MFQHFLQRAAEFITRSILQVTVKEAIVAACKHFESLGAEIVEVRVTHTAYIDSTCILL